MTVKPAYEYTNAELLQRLMDASGRAGISHHPRSADHLLGSHWNEAQYLGGVVLSRMDGKTPPFKRGDLVKFKPDSKSLRVLAYWFPKSDPKGTYTVARVHYKNSNWLLELQGVNWKLESLARCSAEEFDLVPAPAPA